MLDKSHECNIPQAQSDESKLKTFPDVFDGRRGQRLVVLDAHVHFEPYTMTSLPHVTDTGGYFDLLKVLMRTPRHQWPWLR